MFWVYIIFYYIAMCLLAWYLPRTKDQPQLGLGTLFGASWLILIILPVIEAAHKTGKFEISLQAVFQVIVPAAVILISWFLFRQTKGTLVKHPSYSNAQLDEMRNRGLALKEETRARLANEQPTPSASA